MTADKKLDMALDEIVKDDSKGSPKGKGKGKRAGKSDRRPAPYTPSYAGYSGSGRAGSSKGKGSGSSKGSSKGGGRSANNRRPAGFRTCKVGPETEVHNTAGYIANAMREGCPVNLKAGSSQALNQAMKAIALSRSFLEEEDLDLVVRPMLADFDNTGDKQGFNFSVSAVIDGWVRSELSKNEAVELFVSGDSDPYKVAGAIAKNTRGNFRTFCTAMGAQAVQKAAQSVCLTQRYLEGDALDITFVPAFATTKDGASLLQFQLFAGFDRCKAGPESNVHSTAGFIAAGARSGCPPTILGAGASSINQGIKALALSRSYLEADGLDIVAQPAFPEYDERTETEAVQISLFPYMDTGVRARVASDATRGEELFVSSHSDPTKVAGALAKRVRDNADIYLTAMGPQAILNGLRSIYLARRYLADEEYTLAFVPEFGKSNEGASLLYLHVLATY